MTLGKLTSLSLSFPIYKVGFVRPCPLLRAVVRSTESNLRGTQCLGERIPRKTSEDWMELNLRMLVGHCVLLGLGQALLWGRQEE